MTGWAHWNFQFFVLFIIGFSLPQVRGSQGTYYVKQWSWSGKSKQTLCPPWSLYSSRCGFCHVHHCIFTKVLNVLPIFKRSSLCIFYWMWRFWLKLIALVLTSIKIATRLMLGCVCVCVCVCVREREACGYKATWKKAFAFLDANVNANYPFHSFA